MPPKKVKPTRPISISVYLDVLYKPPRGKISNLGLI
ncbi:putative oligopeptide transporter [Venturia inaequalis]|nr:putative oligopeptide transporter [Venturia inaequalis]